MRAHRFADAPLLSRRGLFLQRKLFDKDKDKKREILIIILGVIVKFTTIKTIKARKAVKVTIIKITKLIIIKTTSIQVIIKIINTLIFLNRNRPIKFIKEFII